MKSVKHLSQRIMMMKSIKCSFCNKEKEDGVTFVQSGVDEGKYICEICIRTFKQKKDSEIAKPERDMIE
jgi:transcription elongation factor Elf1